VTATVLLGGGFWSAPPLLDPVTGLPAQAGVAQSDGTFPGGATLTDASTGNVSVTVAVPGGTTTTALRGATNDSTFTGYLSRPGTIITTIPQRVSIVPARRDDTLESIAGRMNSTSTALMWANGITDPTRVLPAGQTIRVPPSGTMLHRIKETDTLDSIARAYQVKVQDITSYPGNNVLESSDLVPGAFLIIPTTNLPTRDHTVFYQVQEGDSLARISAIYALGNPLTLRWANNLPGDIIYPGQIIAVPPADGVIHVVEQVDTQRNIDDAVTQIAKNFACAAIPCKDPPSDLRVNDIASRIFAFGGNHLTHGGKLVPGQEIMIPGGIPYVEPPPVIIPQNVALDNPNTSAGSAADNGQYTTTRMCAPTCSSAARARCACGRRVLPCATSSRTPSTRAAIARLSATSTTGGASISTTSACARSAVSTTPKASAPSKSAGFAPRVPAGKSKRLATPVSTTGRMIVRCSSSGPSTAVAMPSVAFPCPKSALRLPAFGVPRRSASTIMTRSPASAHATPRFATTAARSPTLPESASR
jgi:LysM repeat protein